MEPSSEEDEHNASRYFLALCIPLFFSNCAKAPKPVPAAIPRTPVIPVVVKTPLRKPLASPRRSPCVTRSRYGL